MRRRTRSAGVVACFAIAWLVPAAPSWAVAVPTAHLLDPGTATVGSQVVVQGAGWPARTVVNLEVCGNAAIDGSGDCDLSGAANAGVGASGTFSMSLAVARPPTPCPCVVWVTDLSSVREARVPLSIVALPSALPHYQVVSPNLSDLVRITGARVSGGTGLLASLGWPSHRTLVLDIANTSAIPVSDALLTAHIGRGPHPTDVLPSMRVSLAPHADAIERIPISLGWFSNGTYTVRGQVGSFGTPATFSTSTAAQLWGLLVLGLAAIQCLLLALRNRLRRRLNPDDAAGPEDPAPFETEENEPMDHSEPRVLDDLIGAKPARFGWLPRLGAPWRRPDPAAVPAVSDEPVSVPAVPVPAVPVPAAALLEPSTLPTPEADAPVVAAPAAIPAISDGPVPVPAVPVPAVSVPAVPAPGTPWALIAPDLAAVLAEQQAMQDRLPEPLAEAAPAPLDALRRERDQLVRELNMEVEHAVNRLQAEVERAANRLSCQADVAVVRVGAELEGALRRLRAELEAESAQTRLTQLAYTERVRQMARTCLMLLDEASLEPDGLLPVERPHRPPLAGPPHHPSEM
ncbi:MAG TPA: hypothetical protein VFH58_13445 [Acidimicrobiales bacterium]|nr:hypothetical protein [Acidimicrobiales bacterium]